MRIVFNVIHTGTSLVRLLHWVQTYCIGILRKVETFRPNSLSTRSRGHLGLVRMRKLRGWRYSCIYKFCEPTAQVALKILFVRWLFHDCSINLAKCNECVGWPTDYSKSRARHGGTAAWAGWAHPKFWLGGPQCITNNWPVCSLVKLV